MRRHRLVPPRRAAGAVPLILLALALAGVSAAAPRIEAASRPNVLLVTVDTLRADRLSAYGYARDTTPHIDRLMSDGVRFEQARTIEPLTGPALASLITSVHPHEHGATRNGLRVKPGLASLPKTLQAHGYLTRALVGSWTLRDRLCGLGEHFERYQEVLTRRRWFGVVRNEATGADLTDEALGFLDGHVRGDRTRPFFLWIHYVEPHAPYRLHGSFRARLGLPPTGDVSRADRYDTEIAFVDAQIGRLLAALERLGLRADTLVAFAADHGESLGEHGEWGHGRDLYEPALRIPMSLTWPGRLASRVVEAPALLIDLAPTILSLIDENAPAGFRGLDWTVALGGGPAPIDRLTLHQAHRGAVLSKHDSDLARRSGLLQVGLIRGGHKETFHVRDQRREAYDLRGDPTETRSLTAPRSTPTEGLLTWMRVVFDELRRFDDMPPEPLDPESAAQLRSLGYVD